jgi:hypothetical protein
MHAGLLQFLQVEACVLLVAGVLVAALCLCHAQLQKGFLVLLVHLQVQALYALLGILVLVEAPPLAHASMAHIVELGTPFAAPMATQSLL